MWYGCKPKMICTVYYEGLLKRNACFCQLSWILNTCWTQWIMLGRCPYISGVYLWLADQVNLDIDKILDYSVIMPWFTNRNIDIDIS